MSTGKGFWGVSGRGAAGWDNAVLAFPPRATHPIQFRTQCLFLPKWLTRLDNLSSYPERNQHFSGRKTQTHLFHCAERGQEELQDSLLSDPTPFPAPLPGLLVLSPQCDRSPVSRCQETVTTHGNEYPKHRKQKRKTTRLTGPQGIFRSTLTWPNYQINNCRLVL